MTEPDVYSQTREEFGVTAMHVLDGIKKTLESLRNGYVVLDRYPPGGHGEGNQGGTNPPPGGTSDLAASLVDTSPMDEGDALAPVLSAIDYLRRFTARVYLEEGE